MFPALLAAATPAAKASPITLPANALQLPLTAPAPQSWLAVHAPWLTHTFAGIFIIAAVLMIALLALQTTKQEGLSGTIGGRVESAYRGRLGADQQIARFTAYAAITYVIMATLLSLSGI